MYDSPCRKNVDFWPKNHHKFNKRVISLKCDMVTRKKGPGFLRMWSGFPKRGLSFLSKVHAGLFGNRVKFCETGDDTFLEFLSCWNSTLCRHGDSYKLQNTLNKRNSKILIWLSLSVTSKDECTYFYCVIVNSR